MHSGGNSCSVLLEDVVPCDPLDRFNHPQIGCFSCFKKPGSNETEEGASVLCPLSPEIQPEGGHSA